MQNNTYPDRFFYSNIRDEMACINKYASVRKLSQKILTEKTVISNSGIISVLGRTGSSWVRVSIS